MSYIKTIRKISSKNKQSNAKRALDYLKDRIEEAAEKGYRRTDMGVVYSYFKLTDREYATVLGTLKRMGFKTKYDTDRDHRLMIVW